MPLKNIVADVTSVIIFIGFCYAICWVIDKLRGYKHGGKRTGAEAGKDL
jgi:hypothetical protein